MFTFELMEISVMVVSGEKETMYQSYGMTTTTTTTTIATAVAATITTTTTTAINIDHVCSCCYPNTVLPSWTSPLRQNKPLVLLHASVSRVVRHGAIAQHRMPLFLVTIA